jgi:hypothetical protein
MLLGLKGTNMDALDARDPTSTASRPTSERMWSVVMSAAIAAMAIALFLAAAVPPPVSDDSAATIAATDTSSR